MTGVSTKADTTNKNLTALDQKFQNRNNYRMSTQKIVLFKFDSATLTDEGKAALDEVAGTVTSNPDALLVLEGHTDNMGDHEYNIRLGERRIEAVKRYLAVDKGVPVYKIEEISFGSEKPVGSERFQAEPRAEPGRHSEHHDAAVRAAQHPQQIAKERGI